MSLKTRPLPTLTTIATTSPIKKILLWTFQMAMKTEDSLVFSWEGRHTPFSFCFLFQTFLLDVYFHLFDFPSFTFILVIYLYVHNLHSEFTSVSSSHSMPSVNFPSFTKTLPWRDIFASCDTIANAMKQRFLAMMNCSEPFLFLLILCFTLMYLAFPLSF